MSIEVQRLTWSVVLLVVYIMVTGAFVMPLRGMTWNAGPRDGGQPPLGKYSGRAQRALENLKETYPAFVALSLGLVLTSRTGGIGALGSTLWFVGRCAYMPLYLLGVPWLRTIAWTVSMAGLVLMFLKLL